MASYLHFMYYNILLFNFFFIQIEKIILQGARDGLLQVRLNHRDRSLSFGTNVLVAQSDKQDNGPKLQALRSEMMRSQLTTLSKRLYHAYDLFNPTVRVTVSVISFRRSLCCICVFLGFVCPGYVYNLVWMYTGTLYIYICFSYVSPGRIYSFVWLMLK